MNIFRTCTYLYTHGPYRYFTHSTVDHLAKSQIEMKTMAATPPYPVCGRLCKELLEPVSFVLAKIY